MELTSLATNFSTLWEGVLLTLQLLLAGVGFGLTLSILLTTASFLNTGVKKIVDAYIFIMRGTPMLVQFYFIYYGLAQITFLHDTWLWGLIISPIACSIIALTLNTGAYTTVILRGAFLGVPAGEQNAARSLGFSRIQIFRHITFPRALSLILPVYSNEVLMLLKGTSLASTITVLELTGITQQLIGETYQTLLYWLVTGAIYLVISGVIILLFKVLEYYCHRYIPHQS